MGGKLSKEIQKALYKADFEKITDYICSMCRLAVEDYGTRQRQMPNDENAIRSIMLEEYMKKQKAAHDMSGYRFDPEALEHYDGNGNYFGRVDIRILLKSDFEKDEACYIVECKRIDGNSDLNKKYVQEGVARFVTQKYSSYYGRNVMLGFVVRQIDVSENVKKIEKIQSAEPDEHMHGTFRLLKSDGVTESYECIYQIQSGELELCHIFSDYSGIVADG